MSQAAGAWQAPERDWRSTQRECRSSPPVSPEPLARPSSGASNDRPDGVRAPGFGDGHHIDDVEFDVHALGRVLGVYAGFGMRIAFVDEDAVAGTPEIVIIRERDHGEAIRGWSEICDQEFPRQRGRHAA